MLTPFELVYVCAEPTLPAIYAIVRRRLRRALRGAGDVRPNLLDVGGRKSHYTIGLPARVTVTDLRRSNVSQVVLDDMTHSALPDASFDCVVAVEVIEHVADDEAFVREIRRVLKPGGQFLATTPNGDARPNTNPDHKRHYKWGQLHALLSRHFPIVRVEYAIPDGVFHSLGLRSWSIRRPVRTAVGMAANVVNGLQSGRTQVQAQAGRTCHLIATAKKGA